MKKFKTHLQEMAAVKAANLDTEFLKRAQKITSFNLRSFDFESLKHKAEIQFLIKTHFFPNFDLNKTIKGDINANQVNKLIDELKRESRAMYNKLHFYNLKGVGPGEATLFFLLDDAHLGGGTSAGVDLVVGSSKYEVKASMYSKKEGTVHGFKLGGTVPLGNLVSKIVDLKNQMGMATKGKGEAEVNSSQLAELRKKFPKEMKQYEAEYARIAGKYFGNTPVIFINNNSSSKVDEDFPAEKTRQLSNDAGGIVTIKQVKEKDIMMHVVTQGTIKPKVKI
jgi:hypothetical protein